LSLFGWLVADGWCWCVLREEYCWLVVDGWFVLREKYCWLVADKPSEQAGELWNTPSCRRQKTDWKDSKYSLRPKKNDILLNLACVHVGMQQSIST
jgi:hypothetical protein